VFRDAPVRVAVVRGSPVKSPLAGKLVFAALAIAVLSCGCGAASQKQPGLPFTDDFSSATCQWDTAKDPFVSAGCVRGGYRVLVRNPLVPQNIRRFVTTGVQSLRVEADAVQRAGTGSTLYGVSCWSARDKGYIFGVSPGGAWAIFKIDLKANPIQTSLAESPAAKAIPRTAKANRIRGECISSGQKATTLALYVNGKRIAEARDSHGHDPFKGYGFFVKTTKAGADARFDNFDARVLSKSEAAKLTQAGSENTSADASKIVFTSTRDGNYEIYVMNADGSEQTRLTRNPADDGFAAWSPDGKRMAFRSNRDGNYEIYVMNADGSDQARLTRNPAEDGSAAWSPDGKKIAFQSNRDGNYDIYVMNADGSDQTRLTRNQTVDALAAWSPDGTKIAFASNRDGPKGELYVMNADGSDQTRLTRNQAIDALPAWSPDGAKIVFGSNRDGNYEIYVMNADGSGQTRLTRNAAADNGATWSPDGKKIRFDSDRDGNLEVYVMNTDGSNETNLTQNSNGEDFDADSRPH
jgi:hypothetical protein